ncbi:MAG: MarR family transcriptional regulator [Clostridiales bacterium]|jgi:DNA-binding MarR family transcriptional regulator|nr:MarR family transcriptional regulator [Clostridiales bacterium]
MSMHSLTRNFQRLRRRMGEMMCANLRAHDITWPQAQILFFLFRAEAGRYTVSEIQAKIHTPMSNVTNICNRLSDMGLIEKERRGDDQRKVFVRLTEKGRELGKTFDRGREKMDQMFAGLMSEAEKQKVTEAFAILDRLAARMNDLLCSEREE